MVVGAFLLEMLKLALELTHRFQLVRQFVKLGPVQFATDASGRRRDIESHYELLPRVAARPEIELPQVVESADAIDYKPRLKLRVGRAATRGLC